MHEHSNQIPEAIRDWSRQALDLDKGAQLLLLGDDPAGRGRHLFRLLRRQMQGRGLRVIEVACHERTNGGPGLGLARVDEGDDTAWEEDYETRRENVVESLRRGLTGLRSKEPRPVVLFVEDVEHCDDHTQLLIEMLLDRATEDYPFSDAPDLRAVVVALDGRGPVARTLSGHPRSMNFSLDAPVVADSGPRRRLPSDVIRAIRLVQMADLPLRVSELDQLAGPGMLDRLADHEVPVEHRGRGAAARIAVEVPEPAGLPAPDSLPEKEQRLYHERLLDVFEARADGASVAVARLKHAVGAAAPVAVIRHVGPATDALVEMQRRTEARDLLASSLAVLAGLREHATESIRLRRRLARLEATAGRPLDAAAAIRAIPRSRRSASDERLLALGLLHAGRPHEAHEAIRAWISGQPRSTAKPAVRRMHVLLAEVEYTRGNLDEAGRICRDLSNDAGLPSADRARVRNTLGKVYLARGTYAEAERIFRENLKRARKARLERPSVVARINAGIARMRLTHYASARKLFGEALSEAREKGFYREEAIARENIATVHHMMRDYGEALEHYRQAFVLLRYLGNPEYLARIANNLGEIYLRFGNLERARATRSFATHMGADHPVSLVEAEGLLLDGRISLMQGDTGRAAEIFDRAARLFESLDDRHHRAEALVWQATARIQIRQLETAEKLLDEAEPHSQGDPRMSARLLLERGRLQRIRGIDARPTLTRALEALEAGGDLEGEIEALYDLSELELDRGDTVDAREHLERARKIDGAIRARIPEAHLESFDSTLIRRQLATLDLRARTMEERLGRIGAGTERPRERRPAVASPTSRLVGESEPMQVVYRAIGRVAPIGDMVLVEGESGTGKELVAEAIHALSDRADKPLVKVNCASFVENLLQSELFGHERGAFTGAVKRRRGWFETASSGTLFLDEIGDIPASTQVNLLRVLQDRTIYRVGGTQPVSVDVRIIAATNRDLARAVAEGRFRKDLYYRLQGIRIVIPPLRQRTGDVRLLVDHMLDGLCTEFDLPRDKTRFSEGALRLLEDLPWPGNVRELENTVRSAVLFAEGGVVTQRDVEPYIANDGGNSAARQAVVPPVAEEPEGRDGDRNVDINQVLMGAVSLPQFKKEIERKAIAAALGRSKGNITRAAGLLGMKRPRLSQLVKYYGIPRDVPDEE